MTALPTQPDLPAADPSNVAERSERIDIATSWRAVGRRIQVRRARLGKPQGQVAGISRATLSRLEMGRPVSLTTLARVEGELGFQEHELVSEVFGDPLVNGSPARSASADRPT